MAQGNVESWLGELLHGSHKSLHKIIRDANMAIQVGILTTTTLVIKIIYFEKNL